MSNNPIPNLNLPDDLESQYVNFVRIAHTASEFVFDYSLLLPGIQKPEVNTRLVMSPIAAKLFLRALSDNVSRYETNFGEITLPVKHSLADDLFKANPPEE